MRYQITNLVDTELCLGPDRPALLRGEIAIISDSLRYYQPIRAAEHAGSASVQAISSSGVNEPSYELSPEPKPTPPEPDTEPLLTLDEFEELYAGPQKAVLAALDITGADQNAATRSAAYARHIEVTSAG